MCGDCAITITHAQHVLVYYSCIKIFDLGNGIVEMRKKTILEMLVWKLPETQIWNSRVCGFSAIEKTEICHKTALSYSIVARSSHAKEEGTN